MPARESERLSGIIHRLEAQERMRQAKQAPATTAAVEPPRFKVGDRVRHCNAFVGDGVVVRTDGPSVHVHWDRLDCEMQARALNCTLLTPATYREDVKYIRESAIVSARWHGIPDPYAAPTIDGQAALLPPMPSEPPDEGCARCGVPTRSSDHAWCPDCCDCEEDGIADDGCCVECGEYFPEHRRPAPDLSLTNECGFPTMPKRRGFADEVGEAIDTAKHVAQKPARPVPQCGDVRYREGDRVVVLQDRGRPCFVGTVAAASPRGAVVHVMWRGGHGSFDRKDLRPATAKEAASDTVH